jgi:PEP-CTERM motif
MKGSTTIALVVLISVGLAANDAVAERLTFDDITAATSLPIPSGYGGLTWDNLWVVNGSADPRLVGTGYANGRISGEFAAFNNNGDPAAIRDDLFTFDSAYFTSAWRTGLKLEIGGWSGVTQLFATDLVLNTTSPTFFSPGWSGLDRLTFRSSGGLNAGFDQGDGVQFAMDDFVFTEGTAPVPEPASMLLLATGLLGVGARHRRLLRQQSTPRSTRRLSRRSLRRRRTTSPWFLARAARHD